MPVEVKNSIGDKVGIEPGDIQNQTQQELLSKNMIHPGQLIQGFQRLRESLPSQQEPDPQNNYHANDIDATRIEVEDYEEEKEEICDPTPGEGPAQPSQEMMKP